jgi:hypothetical protein
MHECFTPFLISNAHFTGQKNKKKCKSEIKMLTCAHKFYDIEPENEEIIKQDCLEFDYYIDKKTYSKIHVIGNPPFGRQSSVTIKFIKKSCEFCDDCSFILPKSFRKNSLKRVFPINFHLINEIDLPSNSFLVDGGEHDVPCVFQIWQKKETNRDQDEKLEPINFRFVKKIEGKSNESHYFIKFTNRKSVADNIERLSLVVYNFNNTIGPKSISKQELIKYWNGIL